MELENGMKYLRICQHVMNFTVASKKHIIFAVVLSCVFNMFTVAYAHCGNTITETGRGFVILEMNHADIQDMNSSLQRSGYPSFSKKIAGIGIGGYSISCNRIVFDGYAMLYIPAKRHLTMDGVRHDTSLSGLFGVYNIGYCIYNKNGIGIFPLVGIGFGGLRFSIRDRSDRTFDDILKKPNGTTLSSDMIVTFNCALGIDRMIFTRETGYFQRGFATGIRIGYKYSPQKYGWTNVVEGPDIFLTGPYINLTIGGGYNKKKQ
ncbi:hypothetical protein LLG96_16360 [bacterium]|nr:hypothetical protein [bacterium]